MERWGKVLLWLQGVWCFSPSFQQGHILFGLLLLCQPSIAATPALLQVHTQPLVTLNQPTDPIFNVRYGLGESCCSRSDSLYFWNDLWWPFFQSMCWFLPQFLFLMFYRYTGNTHGMNDFTEMWPFSSSPSQVGWDSSLQYSTQGFNFPPKLVDDLEPSGLSAQLSAHFSCPFLLTRSTLNQFESSPVL